MVLHPSALLVMLVAWVHGCIGLGLWLRIKPSLRAAMPWLLAAAVLVPTLAMLGLFSAIVLWTYVPKRRALHEENARIPLNDDYR